MHDLSYSSFDSGDMPHFEKGSLIKLENGDCKKVEELSRDDFEKVTYCSKIKRELDPILYFNRCAYLSETVCKTLLVTIFYSAVRTVLTNV